jgi:hypothetical protein
MMKLLSVLTLLAILNGLGIILKLDSSLAAELNPIIEQSMQQKKDCPVYRRCQEVGGSR